MPDRAPAPFDLPVLREMRAELVRVAGEPAVETRSPWRRRATMAMVTAAAVALLCLALFDGGEHPQLGAADASAARVLNGAALVADRQTTTLPPSNEFYYVRSETRALSGPEGSSRIVARERESWISLERAGIVRERLTETGTKTRFAVPALRAYAIGDLHFDRAAFLSYAPDPADLYRHLREAARGRGTSTAASIFSQIGDALRETPTTPTLRAALFRTLALVPGIHVEQDVRLATGKTATAATHTSHGVRQELLFDPRSTEIVAEREVVVAAGVLPKARPGTVIRSTQYMSRATVSNIPGAASSGVPGSSCSKDEFAATIHARVVSVACASGWAVTRLSLKSGRTNWALWRSGPAGYRTTYITPGGTACPSAITKRVPVAVAERFGCAAG